MYRYRLPGVELAAPVLLPNYAAFAVAEEGQRKTVTLAEADGLLLRGKELFTACHKELNIAALEDGWRFSLPNRPEIALAFSKDRSRILTAPLDASWKVAAVQPLLRTALECASALEGVISLHAACVEREGEAICFSAASGVGKSTRAKQWQKTLGAELISGDRPAICVDGEKIFACGVPWDGKEGIYKNVRLPLKMICAIVRDDRVSARRLTRSQARQFLMRQTFLPMWDTEAAVAVMAVLRKIYDRVPVVELRCGPDEASAQEVYELIYHHPECILEETEL